MADEKRPNQKMGLPQPLTEAFDPDQPLFEALRAGDTEVLAELMQRHGRWVRGVVYAVLGNARDVDDVCQQVWLAVWRRASGLEDAARWRPWLYRMAHNAAIDVGRRTRRQRSLWAVLTAQFPRGKTAAPNVDAPQRLIVQERYREALRAIEGLPEIYREPFVLRHLEGWTYRQISEALDMPEDTVETRLVRARRLLREVLKDRDEAK
jgi:RNA polymerase sigma-70 factor (ECF subfamily)